MENQMHFTHGEKGWQNSPTNKSKERFIQLICAFEKHQVHRRHEDTMENQRYLCRNDLLFQWIHLITKGLSWGVYQIAWFQEKLFSYQVSILLLQWPVAALPSLTSLTDCPAQTPPHPVASCLLPLTAINLVFFFNATLSSELIWSSTAPAFQKPAWLHSKNPSRVEEGN